MEIGMYSCLEMIPYSQESGCQNKLMSIANMCAQCQLIVIGDSQKDAKKLLEKTNNSVIEVLQDSFIESEATNLITSIKWPEEENFFAFDFASCLIS